MGGVRYQHLVTTRNRLSSTEWFSREVCASVQFPVSCCGVWGCPQEDWQGGGAGNGDVQRVETTNFNFVIAESGKVF